MSEVIPKGHPFANSQLTGKPQGYRLIRWSFWETRLCSRKLGASNLGTLRGR
jgi:hypothetical protein